jgi:hypothetical protein
VTVRESFVARFGEDQAVAIENASRDHMTMDSSIHAEDSLGSDPFKYHFLNAVSYECISRPRFREHHGITADLDAMRDWALTEGDLGGHDGDVPDYLALLVGVYDEWIVLPSSAEKEVQ